MKKILTIVASAIAISAAGMMPNLATAQTAVYQPASDNGGAGYTSAYMGDNQYVVVFTGDSKTKRDLAANYAMLRAAELTTETGFEWFAVLSSTVKSIEQGGQDDIASRTGPFMGGTQTSVGATGADTTSGGGTASGGTFNAGASSGGFGGGDVPPAVLERWKPKKVVQAALIIQMGNGDDAKFEGVKKQPEIFAAKATAEELRASMK